MNATATTAVNPLRTFLVHCAGQHYTALATSAGMAICDAMARHGVHAATAKPLGAA